jgi:hypothetical protein
MDNAGLLRILKEVPECHLRIIDLAREAVKDDGSIDPELISFRQIELKEAVAEAEAYAEATGEAVKCIKTLGRS